ncbi:hypothetical protein NQZ68_015161 [Dissostichus eleginoides]|nr:hypothetical protein NQZ68_015161 [Dissostichus eleginoides]
MVIPSDMPPIPKPEHLFEDSPPSLTAQYKCTKVRLEMTLTESQDVIDPRLRLLRQRGQTIGATTGTASSNLPTTGSLPHPQPPATHRGALDTPLGRICKRSSNSGSGQSSNFNALSNH